MTASPAEIADVVDKAIAHIKKVGWFQDGLYDDSVPGRPPVECPCDAMGALNVAIHGTPKFVARKPGTVPLTATEVSDLLRPRMKYVSLAAWQHKQGRTQDEVLNLLRKFAKELRGVR